MNNVIIISILILNFALMLAGYYAFNTYLYFSLACKRGKNNKDSKKTESGIPPIYEILQIDGIPGKLQGYYLPGYSKHLVILVHGWMDDAASRLDDVSFYKEQGYHVFIPDLRAHGASSGKYLGMGITDSVDLVDWVRYFKDKLGSDTEIIIDGVSVGAAAVLHMDADFINQYVKAIVSDSSYEKLDQIIFKLMNISRKYKMKFNAIGINCWCRLFGKYKIKDGNVLENIKNIKIPVLIIGGDMDKIVPIDAQRRLQAACGGKCTLWISQKASHAKAAYADRTLYNDVINQFLKSI